MTKSNCWKGMAIAGIWIGTAIIAFPAPGSVIGVAIVAGLVSGLIAVTG